MVNNFNHFETKSIKIIYALFVILWNIENYMTISKRSGIEILNINHVMSNRICEMNQNRNVQIWTFRITPTFGLDKRRSLSTRLLFKQSSRKNIYVLLGKSISNTRLNWRNIFCFGNLKSWTFAWMLRSNDYSYLTRNICISCRHSFKARARAPFCPALDCFWPNDCLTTVAMPPVRPHPRPCLPAMRTLSRMRPDQAGAS